ncbi:MAG TPA: DUF3352 domain-containing protein [Micromonosporaceae bacterium]|nr:DUF3352 domain-containing protein [Micromonosporaceae bacterium]
MTESTPSPDAPIPNSQFARPSGEPTVPQQPAGDTTIPQTPGPVIDAGTTYLTGAPDYDPTAPQPTFVQFGDAAPKRGIRRRRAIIASSAVVVTLLAGVGAYAGVRAWTGSDITEPETAMPASIGAFARIDVNPGVANKLTVNNLVKKFPNTKSASELITRAETEISKQVGLDFKSDVQPWFGGQAGVAVWSDHGKPVVLIALASTNDTKAAATLSALRQRKGADSFGFAMEGGYALIAGGDGDMQAEATAAVKAARDGSLADDITFRRTVSHVGDGNLLLAYADLSKMTSLLSGQLGAPLSLFGGLDGGLLGGANSKTATAQIAIGGKVTGDGLELRIHAEGTAVTSGTKVMSTLRAMPSATIAGASISGLDPSSETAKSLGSLVGLLALGSSTQSLAGPDPLAGGDPFDGDPLGNDPSGGGGFAPGGPPDAVSQFLLTGVTQLLTSKQLSVAFTGVSNDMPNLLINVEARSESAATSLMDSFNQLTKGQLPDGINVTQNGTSITATIGNPATGGSLGSSSLFQETMSGMSDATSAVYLDIQRVLDLAGGDMSAADRANLAPIKAVGFSSTGSDVLVRVVIK